MNKLRYYVLTSRHPETLLRCLRTLPLTRTVVVINTLDSEFASIASDICIEKDVEFHITQSDGTPGTGKNALLKTFLGSDDEYAVCVDGDDFLTPHGVYLYDYISTWKNVPDLIVTHNELYSDCGDTTQEFFMGKRDYREWKGKGEFNTLNTVNHQFYKPLEDDIQKVLEEKVLEETANLNWKEEDAVHWATQWNKFINLMNNIGDISVCNTRMVFWSRKVAELAHYSNELYIGEDTIQYFDFKQMYGRGEIDICYHLETPFPTYIYVSDNIREPGICYLSHPTDIDWVDNMFKVIEQRPPYEYGEHTKPVDIFEYKNR